MDGMGEGKLWLDPEECKALFPRLKGQEKQLSVPERGLLRRMEKFLYERLSIQELEALQAAPPGPGFENSGGALA